jgi:hypothetical protein
MPDIEEQIRRAQEEGQFKDLPGKGKPLRLDENPHEDPEWRLAHHILRESGFSLPWIERLREIEADLGAARAALQQAWAWHQSALAQGQPYAQVQAEWERAQAAFRTEAARLNQRIGDYNLGAPAHRFQRPKVNAGREIEALVSQDMNGRE